MPASGDLQGDLPVHRVLGLQAGVAQVVNDDLRHGQIVFNDKNARVYDLSLRTPSSSQERSGAHSGAIARFFSRLS